MQLRSFFAFNKSAGAIPVLVGYDSKPTSFPCKLTDAVFNYSGSGSEYIQIFDKASAPSVGNVPVYSILTTGAGAYSLFETMGPLTLSTGFSVGISSTRATYTASATAYDVVGNIEEFEDSPVGTSTAGDLTSPVENQVIWTSANGPKTLIRADVLPDGLTVATTRYLMLFANESPTNGDYPIMQWPFTDSDSVTTLHFGKNGFVPQQLTAAGTLYKGCYFVLSNTAKTLTTGADTMRLLAYYK